MTEIVFFTSSPVKLAHARYLCRDYDVLITGFREKTFGANYEEPRIYDREELIKQSYQDALKRWKKNVTSSDERLFFIEDTSVVIEVLSTEEQEIPGLDVKYWMAETNFAALDKQLKELGNNRRASVRSDLVLHLSKDLRELAQNKPYLCFTSSVDGNIVNKELNIETNPLYPWLDNKTFNKWFVPNGCKKPISILPIAEADKYDFRANAFKEMLAFLEQNKKINRRSEPIKQHSLVEEPLFIICGPSCAGKTTLAEHLAEKYGFYHIEASDFMYLSYYQRHGVTSTVKIGDFAEQALKDQPEIVAQQILQNIQENKANLVVVTGFRSSSEIDWFQNYYTGVYPILVCFVTADADIRFMRSVSRNRDETASNRDTFDSADKQQLAMGLGTVEKRFFNTLLENNEKFDSFFSNFEKRYLKDKQLSPSKQLATSELEKLILLALLNEWSGRKYFTTTEIAHLINEPLSEKPKSKNNISRYFNQRYYPYFDINLIDGKRKYRLSNTGYGKARLWMLNKTAS